MIKKITKLLALSCLTSLLITSCNDDDLNSSNSEQNLTNESVILLKERSDRYPVILKKSKHNKSSGIDFNQNSLNNQNQYTPMTNFLGISYNLETIPYYNNNNFKAQIIDINKLIANETNISSIIRHTPIRKINSQYFSYSSHTNYIEKSTVSKKVNKGFELGVKVFGIGLKFGSKKTIEDIFKSHYSEDNKTTYGELNVNVVDGSYELIYTNSIRDKISDNYLTQYFIDDLYNYPLEDLLTTHYGPFVLSGFYHGGNATAHFIGKSSNVESITETQRKMDKNINASISYSYKEDNSVEGKLDFGKNSDNYKLLQNTDKFQSLYTSISTSGGGYGFDAFTNPQQLDNVSINLSNWVSSFSDLNNHVISDIKDGGLIPVSEFIKEINFKNRIQNFYTNPSLVNYLVEPSLEVIVYNTTSQQKSISIYMNTRHKDKIHIKSFIKDFSGIPLQKGLLDIANEITQTYDMKCNYRIINSKNFNDYNYGNLNINNSTKYYDSNNNILYLLFKDNKIALSIYDNFILETYGIKHVVDNLPNSDVTEREFRTYTRLGL